MIDEIRNINNITSEEFALAITEEYNLEVVLLKEKGKPYLIKAVPVVYVNEVPGIRMIMIDLDGIYGVGNLGIYTGSKSVKKQGLKNELQRNSIEVNKERIKQIRERIRNQGLHLLGTVEGELGLYRLKNSVKGMYITEDDKLMGLVKDVIIK